MNYAAVELICKGEILETIFKNKTKQNIAGDHASYKDVFQKGGWYLLRNWPFAEFITITMEYVPQYIEGRKDHRIGCLA